MSYGIQVFNSNGNIMFDAAKTLKSYVLKASGTATSVSVSAGEHLFVKLPSSGDNSLNHIVEPQNYPTQGTSATQTFNFYKINPAFTFNKFSESLDYFIIKPSRDFTASGNYGVRIFNSDGTVQFDTRTATQTNNFKIVDFYTYPDTGNGTVRASSNQYISVTSFENTTYPNVWTEADFSNSDDYQFYSFVYLSNGQVKFASFNTVTEELEEGGEETLSYPLRIPDTVYIGELIT